MIDRFSDNELTTPPYDPERAQRGRDPAAGKVFQGGTLRGITSRLDYIRNLGATAIWMTPVLKNRQSNPQDYHGYAPQDFLEVDPRFGSLADLQELVRQAHSRHMRVIMDIVVNHTGDNWCYENNQPRSFNPEGQHPFGGWRRNDGTIGMEDLGADDAVWPVEFQNVDWYKRRGGITDWNNPEQARDGDFLNLKTLDHSRGDVVQALVDVYKYWITVADLDGYRVDAVKHVEDTSVAVLCNSIREYALAIGKENFFLFGEIVGSELVIDRYLGRRALVGGPNEPLKSLDSCLDFPQYFVLEDVIKGQSPPSVLIERFETVSASYTDYGEATYYFVTFVDNHDQMARPFRRFLHGEPHSQRAVLAIAYLLTSRGIPCIYYGTEQAFDGGGPEDIYIRECMFGGDWGAFDTRGCHFFDEQHPVYVMIKKIADIRASHPQLKFGRMYFRNVSGDGQSFGRCSSEICTLAFERVLDGITFVVAMNLSTEARADFIQLDSRLVPSGRTLVDLLQPRRLTAVDSPEGSCIQVPLDPLQIAILRPDPPRDVPQRDSVSTR
jgi:glycosidase